MRLYHFTSTFHWPVVQQQGLSRGDVPTSPGGGCNAVWLTTDPNPVSQNWALAGVDKRAVRITIDISESDPKLKSWREYATKKKSKKVGIRFWIAPAVVVVPTGISTSGLFHRHVPPVNFNSASISGSSGTCAPSAELVPNVVAGSSHTDEDADQYRAGRPPHRRLDTRFRLLLALCLVCS